MEEVEKLLNQAKERLSAQQKDAADPFESVERIPKLQSHIRDTKLSEINTASSQEAQRPVVQLKAMPSATKPTKQDTAGSDWFDMGAPRMTPELKRDLQLLKMRHALDPKRFYKRESAAPSKYFQVGTIKEDPTEFFSARMTRKERKQTLAEEILATRQDYFKSRYKTIQKTKQSGRKKHVKKLRDMRA